MPFSPMLVDREDQVVGRLLSTVPSHPKLKLYSISRENFVGKDTSDQTAFKFQDINRISSWKRIFYPSFRLIIEEGWIRNNTQSL